MVKQVERLAVKKGCTVAQLAISWTANDARRRGLPAIIPIPGATKVATVEENGTFVELSDAELDEIDATLGRFEVKGARYPEGYAVNT